MAGRQEQAATPTDSVAGVDLVVIGAAAGMGRWLCQHVFAGATWRRVLLVDLVEFAAELAAVATVFDRSAVQTRSPDQLAGFRPGVETFLCFAVPDAGLPEALHTAAAFDADTTTVLVVADHLQAPLDEARRAFRHARVVGCHPLFERAALSAQGQTFYLAHPGVAMLQDLITDAGGLIETGPADHHDHVMTYVQRATHLALLSFVQVLVGSGLDLHDDLWAARTPLFEALFSMTSRVLDPALQQVLTRSLSGPSARDVAQQLHSAVESLGSAVGRSEPAVVADHLADLREHFSGTLFETLRNVAASAIGTAQAVRAALASKAADGSLVALRVPGKPDALHVGRIVAVSGAEVTIEDVLVRGSGRGSVLWQGAGIDNGRRAGASGRPRLVTLNIGRVELVDEAELERELDRRLAHLRRDIRFLVPESVAGAGVLAAIRAAGLTRNDRLVSEVVRTGQRAVVVSTEIRADRDLDATMEHLRSLVQATYAWPTGISRPATDPLAPIYYLGPAGTFSEVAARQCAVGAGTSGELVALASFDDVLRCIQDGGLGVLPVSSSSSGLVSRAVSALLTAGTDRDSGSAVTAGGMVDVAVRFDAYARADISTARLRGARLYSHPQALAQCTGYIARSAFEPLACASTADALNLAAASAEPTVALAAAGTRTGSLGLRIVEREVDDIAGAITRFVIVGRPDAFGELSAQYAPTTRALWVGTRHVGGDQQSGSDEFRPDSSIGHAELSAPSARYEEILADADGRYLLITSVLDAGARASDARFLGLVPWSPRTPLVRPIGTPARG